MSLLSNYPTLKRLLQELKHLDQEEPTPKEMCVKSGRDVHRVEWPGLGYFWLTTPQHKVVLVLAEAMFETRCPDVSQAILIAASKTKASRLASVFEGSPAWGKLIIPGKQSGSYRLPPVPKPDEDK